MNKTTFAWMWVVIVFALVVAGGAVAWALGIFAPSYYAVYMTTGDLYFGNKSLFSDTLRNVWYIQRDAQNQSLNLNDFSKVVWGPSGDLIVNEDQVVWMTKLSKESPVISVLKGDVSQQQREKQKSSNTQSIEPPVATSSSTTSE